MRCDKCSKISFEAIGVLGEWMYSPTHSLTSALYEGELSASRPGRFIRRERAHIAHWIGGWVGPRAVLNPRIPIVQPVARRYTEYIYETSKFERLLQNFSP
jgi:hypothetical protein